MRHGLKARNGYLWDGIDDIFDPEKMVGTIESVIDGSDYDNGELETLRDTARNQSLILARLIKRLYENNMLAKKDVLYIVDPSAKLGK